MGTGLHFVEFCQERSKALTVVVIKARITTIFIY